MEFDLQLNQRKVKGGRLKVLPSFCNIYRYITSSVEHHTEPPYSRTVHQVVKTLGKDIEFSLYLTSYYIDFFSSIAYTIVAGRDTLYTRATEFAFKCHAMAPVTGPPKGGFLR